MEDQKLLLVAAHSLKSGDFAMEIYSRGFATDDMVASTVVADKNNFNRLIFVSNQTNLFPLCLTRNYWYHLKGDVMLTTAFEPCQ